MADAASRPRVLFLGRSRYTLPLPAWLAEEVGRDRGDRRLPRLRRRSRRQPRCGRPLPPARARASGLSTAHSSISACRSGSRVRSRDFRPEAIVAADPYIGAAALLGRRLAGATTPVIVEVHGDWRTFTRLYGSPARRLLARSPIASAVPSCGGPTRRGPCRASRRALVEEVRGEPATATFPTYSDLSAFAAEPVQPLPEQPVAVFVGMLEAYKNVDGLASAWRRVAGVVPEARLVIVGNGDATADRGRISSRDLPGQVEHREQLGPAEVAAELDDATRARAAVVARGPRASRDRGLRARSRRRRHRRRRHPRPGRRTASRGC